jgi:hypothetical protein
LSIGPDLKKELPKSGFPYLKDAILSLFRRDTGSSIAQKWWQVLELLAHSAMSNEAPIVNDGFETLGVRTRIQARAENELLQKATDASLVRIEMKLDAAIAAIIALQKRIDSIDAALAQIISR